MVIFHEATYPVEQTFTAEEQLNIDYIRMLVGDTKKLAYDKYGAEGFSDRVLSDNKHYRLEDKGWPLQVKASSGTFTTLSNPQVSNYDILTFQDANTLQDTAFELYYEVFRFSDAELLMAYDNAVSLLLERSLPADKVTGNLAHVQAAIILLEGELSSRLPEYIHVRDGRTEYDAGEQARIAAKRLDNFREQLKSMLIQARHHAALSLDIIRLE